MQAVAYEQVEHTSHLRVVTTGRSSPLIARSPVLNDALSPRGVFMSRPGEEGVAPPAGPFSSIEEWITAVNISIT